MAHSKMFSKSRLIPFLLEGGFIDDESKVDYEAFGHRVDAFISVADMETRKRLEQALIDAGQKVNRNYSPGYPTVEIRVTYFKAWHWDE